MTNPMLWAPLRYGQFRALAGGEVITTLGNGIAPVALAFAVLDLTGSLTALGIVVGARTLANVLFALLGGAVADRLPRRVVLVASTVLAGLTQAAVATTVLTGTATVPLLVALSAANGMVAAFSLPAALALLPQTVPQEIRQQANSIQRVGRNLATIFGAAVGGTLVAAVGPGWGLVGDAASFLLAAGSFALVRVSAAHTVRASQGPLVRQLRDGWAEFTAHSWVWLVVLGALVTNACFSAYFTVLGPFVADTSFGRRGWGLVVAAEGVGLLLGALVAMRLRAKRLLLVGCACLLTVALPPAGLAVWPATVPMMAVAFAGGVGIDVFSVAWETSLQQHIPADRLARVYSYDILGSLVAIPVGQVAVAPVSEALGTRTTLLWMAGILLVVVLAIVGAPSVRRLRQP